MRERSGRHQVPNDNLRATGSRGARRSWARSPRPRGTALLPRGDGVDLLLGDRSRVAERLADVLLLEIGMLGDDLRWRHAVCDEVDHMGDRDPQAAKRRAPGEDVRIVSTAIEHVRAAGRQYGKNNMLNPRAAFVGQAGVKSWVKSWVKRFEGLLAGEET